MTTIHILGRQGIVHPIEVNLRRNEYHDRHIFATQEVVDWLRDMLPALQTCTSAELTPHQQVFAMFRRFITGKPMRPSYDLRAMRPTLPGVWELKTLDVRFFGWFPQTDCYVAARVDSMENAKRYNLYAGYREETIQTRSAMPIAEPKFLTGASLNDVLSSPD